jgi:O-glycosyl hydrolase
MFRDYDGHGATFGNGSVAGSSTDPSALTVYAARRSKDGALTILAVNETANALASTVTVNHTYSHGSVAIYEYASSNPAAIVTAPAPPLTHTLAITFPAQSLTMIVIR